MLSELNPAVVSVDRSTGKQILGHRSYDLGGLHCLVIEHNAFTLEIERDVLRTLGIRRLNESENPGRAFEQHCRAPADIVFCDWSGCDSK